MIVIIASYRLSAIIKSKYYRLLELDDQIDIPRNLIDENTLITVAIYSKSDSSIEYNDRKIALI